MVSIAPMAHCVNCRAFHQIGESGGGGTKITNLLSHEIFETIKNFAKRWPKML